MKRIIVDTLICIMVVPLMAFLCVREVPDGEHTSLSFVNNSNRELLICQGWINADDVDILFENRTEFFIQPSVKNNLYHMAPLTASDKIFAIEGESGESFESILQTNILYFYVFDAEEVRNQAWEDIVRDKSYSLYLVTLDELKAHNFTITYPNDFEVE